MIAQNEAALSVAKAVHQVQRNNDGRPLPSSDVIELLRRIVDEVPGCTLIVDGLDECTFALTEFLREVRTALKLSGSRLLIVSREVLELREALVRPDFEDDVNFSEYRISSHDVEEDVKIFSKELMEVMKLENRAVTLQDDLTRRLVERSKGQFMWAKLQAKALRGSMNRQQLLESLDEAPSSLDEVYSRHWHNIMSRPQRYVSQALRILRWAALSIRPMTVQEIAEAVLIDLKTDGDLPIDPEELPLMIDQDYIDSEIMALCGPFLDLKSPTREHGLTGKEWQTVHLVHASAKDFIFSRIAPDVLDEQEGREHAVLARLCLHFIKFPRVWQQDAGHNAANPTLGFLGYASDFWVHHYRQGMPFINAETRHLVGSMFSQLSPIWDAWTRRFDLQSGWTLDYLQDEKTEGLSPGPLRYASSLNLPSIVKHLIDRGEPIDERSRDGRSALGVASLRGNVDIVGILLEQGASQEIRDHTGLLPIHLATIGGHVGVVRTLLRSHEEVVNALDLRKKSPLILSCDLGRFELAQVMLEKGADVNSVDVHGSGPLHKAIRGGHESITRLLIDYGADINLAEPRQIRPIHISCYFGNDAATNLLLASGVEVNVPMDHELRAIHLVSLKGHLNTLKRLLAKGADLHVRDASGTTSLHIAVSVGQSDVVKRLLEAGADARASDHRGMTPLHFAAVTGDVTSMEALLRAGARRSDVNNEGMTALHLAAKAGHIEAMRCLIEAAEINPSTVPDQREANALHVADIQGWTALHIATRYSSREAVSILLHNGIDVSAVTHDGWSALSLAATSGSQTILEGLIEYIVHLRADIDAVNPNTNSSLYRSTALHVAARDGLVDSMKRLLVAGADIERKDGEGLTPLALAAKARHNAAVDFLISQGAGIIASRQSTSSLPLAGPGHIVSDRKEGALKAVTETLTTSAQGHQGSALIKPTAADSSSDNGSLHDAARKLDLGAVKALLESGHNPNFPSPHHHGRSVLAELCLRGSDEELTTKRQELMQQVLAELIQSGANISYRTKSKSLLHLCLEATDAVTTTRLFLQAGMWKYINHPLFEYIDGDYTYSPTMYVSKIFTSGKSDELLDLLRAYRANDVYYSRTGSQPEGAVGLPEDVAARGRSLEIPVYRKAQESDESAKTLAHDKGLMNEDARRLQSRRQAIAAKPADSRVESVLEESANRLKERQATGQDQHSENTISGLCKTCKQIFESLRQTIPASPYRTLDNVVEDQMGRFQVWAGNIGAFQQPGSTSSLDYRLKESELIRNSVQSGLRRLNSATTRGK